MDGKKNHVAYRFPDPVYTAFFYEGYIVEFGDTDQIFTKPANPKTEAYITGRFG